MTYPGAQTDSSIAQHDFDDVDSRPEAHHHTTGLAPYQHSSGAHDHDGMNSLMLSNAAVAQAVPPGTMIMWVGVASTLPPASQWQVLDGHTIDAAIYPALAKVLGGTGVFALPNFQGRVPVGLSGSDTDFRPEAAIGGSKLVAAGAHSHPLSNAGAALISLNAAAQTTQGRFNAVTSYTATLALTAGSVAGVSQANARGTELAGNTDSTTPAATSVVQPYLVVRFLIKT
jgi:microcystin-dependent protein